MRRVLGWLVFFVWLVIAGALVELVLMAVDGVVNAAPLPVSGPVPGEAGYATMDSAALAAEESAVSMGVTVERAGVIYHLGDRFYFTAPTTSGGGDEFHIGVSFPRGATLVALYHDHPDHTDNDHFSAPDVQVADQLHVASYVGVIQGDKSHVIRYTPGHSQTYHYAGGDLASRDDVVSDGTVVGALHL